MYNNNINGYINPTNITDLGLKDLSAVEILEAFQKKIDKSDLKNSYTRYSTELDLLNKAMTLYPNNSDVYCAFSYIYLQEKDIESSRKYIK